MDALSFVLDSTTGSTVNRVFLKCNSETEKQAFFFSYAAFSTLGKTSPLSGSNYIFVVARVVELLRIHGFPPEVLSATWIYKVFVYSPANLASGLSIFEPMVAEMVKSLAPVNISICPSKRARRSEECRFLLNSSGDCKSIKCAELLINCSLMKMRSISAANRYQTENTDLLRSLEGASPVLFEAVISMMRTNAAVDNLIHYVRCVQQD